MKQLLDSAWKPRGLRSVCAGSRLIHGAHSKGCLLIIGPRSQPDEGLRSRSSANLGIKMHISRLRCRISRAPSKIPGTLYNTALSARAVLLCPQARVVKLADAGDSKSSPQGVPARIPAPGTTEIKALRDFCSKFERKICVTQS